TQRLEQRAVEATVRKSISDHEDRVITVGVGQWSAGSISLGVAMLPCLCVRVACWPLTTTTYDVAQQGMGVNCDGNRSASTRAREPSMSLDADQQRRTTTSEPSQPQRRRRSSQRQHQTILQAILFALVGEGQEGRHRGKRRGQEEEDQGRHNAHRRKRCCCCCCCCCGGRN
ncbi:unnamed protein product, partial [Laminaria digitata]